MGKNNDEFVSIWHLVSEEQKIAYLDAAAFNSISWDVAFIALNDPSEDVRAAALVAFVDCCKSIHCTAKDWLIHPNWYVREAAIRACEKLQLPPAEETIVRVFTKYPESVPRLCEVQNSWGAVVGYCFKKFARDVWNICNGNYVKYGDRYLDKASSKRAAAKMACVRSEETCNHYQAYCWIYGQWAKFHPYSAVQGAEEQAACLLFGDWLAHYASSSQTTA